MLVPGWVTNAHTHTHTAHSEFSVGLFVLMRFSSYVSFDTVMGGAIFKEILHTFSQVGVQSKPNGVLPQAWGYGSHVGSGVTHRYLIAKIVKPTKGKCQSSQITWNYRNKNFTRSLLSGCSVPSGGVIVEIFSKKRTIHWKPRDWYPLQASIVVTTGSMDFPTNTTLRNICLR